MTAYARTTDPDTSHEAAASLDTANSRLYVLGLLTEFGPLADFEIENRHATDTIGHTFYGRLSPSRLRSARSELVAAGHVVASAGFTKTPSGRRALLWSVAP